MNQISLVLIALVQGFKILVRDIACPCFGLYLVFQLAQGKFEVAAIPVIAGLASALIGIPYWSRSDERNRDGEKRAQRRKKLTIDSKGIRWGDDDDGNARN